MSTTPSTPHAPPGCRNEPKAPQGSPAVHAARQPRDRWPATAPWVRKSSSVRQKRIHADTRLAQDGAQRAFWNITGVVRNRGVAISGTLVPNLVGTRCLAVKHKAEGLQTLCDIAVSITRQTTHYALRTTGSSKDCARGAEASSSPRSSRAS